MASKKTIGTRIKLDGEKEFRQSISKCNSSLKLMGQEMKNLKQVYEGNEQSTLALIEKEKLLANQKKVLADKVSFLEKALNKARESYDENSTKVMNYKKSLLEAQNALSKIDNEIESNKKALSDTRRIYEENNKSIKELVLKQAEAEKQYGKNSEEVKNYANQIDNLKNEQKKLMGEMNADRMKEISNQYTLNADKLKDLKNEYEDVVKVFGKNSVEAEKLRKEISQLEQEQSKLNVELKKDDLRNLTKQYESNRVAIKGLKEEYKQTKTYLGENSDSAKKLKIQIDSLTKEQSNLKTSMKQCSTEINKEEKAFKDLEDGAEKAKKEVGTFGKVLLANLASSVIQTGLDKITDGIRNMTTGIISSGANFKSTMSQVSATMGITAQDIENTSSAGYQSYKKLEDSAKEYGRTTKFSASEAAEGLNYMALAGYSVEEATKTLPSVLDLASAGAYDLGTASDQLTDLLTALGYNCDYATTMVDQMAKTSQKSNTDVQGLGDAILQVGGTARGMAGGTHELCTALGLLADNGIHASEGGTKLRNILLALNPTTDKAVDAWKQLGVSGYDAQGNMRPLVDVCGDLNKAMDGMSVQEKKKILSQMFNKTDLKAVEALLGTTKERWKELDGQIVNSQGCAEDMSNTLNANLKGKIILLQSALEGLGISIFEKFDKPFQNVVVHVTDGVGELDKAVTTNTNISDSLSKTGKALEELGVTLVDSIIDSLPTLLDILGTIITTTTNIIGILGDVGKVIGDTLGITDNFGETISKLATAFVTIAPAITAFKVATKAMKLMEEADGAMTFLQALGKLTGVTKLATTAQELFNAVLNMNPFILIAGVLATVITAYAGYNAMLDITGAKECQVSKETNALSNEIKELKDSADNCQIDIRTNTEELLAQKGAMEQNIDQLFELSDSKDKSNATMLKEKNLIDQLNSAYPDLNLKIDEQTGSINMTEDAIRKYIDTFMEQTKLKALQQSLTDSLTRQYEEENKLQQAKEKSVDVNKKVEDAEKALDDAYHSSSASHSKNMEAIANAKKVLADSRAEKEANSKAIEDGNKALEKENENQTFLQGKIQESTVAINKNTEAEKGNKTASEGTAEATKKQVEWTEEASEELGKYSEEVSKDVSSMISLNDEWNGSSDTTAKKILNNFKEQADGQAKYAENLKTVYSKFSDDFVNYLQQTGQDSVQNISALAKASDSEIKGIQSNWKRGMDNSNKVTSIKTGERADIIEKGLKKEQGIVEKGTNSEVKTVKDGENKKNQAISEGGKKSNSAVKSSVNQNTKTMNDGASKAKTAGKNTGNGYSDGINSTKSKSKQSAKNVSDNANKGLEEGKNKAKTNGKNTGENYSDGIKSTSNKAKSSASSVGKTVDSELNNQAKKAKGTGGKVTDNLATGIESKKGKAKGSLEKVGIEMARQNQSMFVRGNDLGKYFIDGFINGMENKRSALIAKAQSLSKAVSDTTQSTLDIHSPSRVAKKLGEFYTEGLAVGIGKIDKVKKATKSVSDEIVKGTKGDTKSFKSNGESIANAVFEGVKEACKKNKKKNLGKELFDTANVKMDYMKKTNKITLDEEENFWRDILTHCKKGSKEYNKVLDKIKKTKEESEKKITEITKTYTDKANKELDKYKKRHDVSIADEIAYWTKIKDITNKGTDEYKEVTDKISELNEQLYQQRKETLKSLSTVEKDYNSKCIARNNELESSLKQLEEDYKSSIKSISSSIQSALGLFDKFESSTDKTSQDLIDNMYSQVLASEQYYDTMENLRKRGVSESLLNDLEKAGVKDLETLKVISNMTDSELQQFQKLYDKRNDFADREAGNEVDSASFEEKRKELLKNAQADLATYKTELDTQTKALEKQLKETYDSVDKTLQSKANTMVTNFKNAIKKYCKTDVAKEGMGYMGTTTVNETNKKKPEAKTAGRNLVNSVASGLESGRGYLASVASSVVADAISAMKEAGGIHSPSRVTRDLIGKNLVLGISEGFKENTKTVQEDMKKGLTETIYGLADVPTGSLQDVIDSSVKFDPSSIQKNLQDGIKNLNFNTPNVTTSSSFDFTSKIDLGSIVNQIAELGSKIEKVATSLDNKEVTLDGRALGKFVSKELTTGLIR